jgi:hypothetical protein
VGNRLTLSARGEIVEDAFGRADRSGELVRLGAHPLEIIDAALQRGEPRVDVAGLVSGAIVSLISILLASRIALCYYVSTRRLRKGPEDSLYAACFTTLEAAE